MIIKLFCGWASPEIIKEKSYSVARNLRHVLSNGLTGSLKQVSSWVGLVCTPSLANHPFPPSQLTRTSQPCLKKDATFN